MGEHAARVALAAGEKQSRLLSSSVAVAVGSAKGCTVTSP
jgi:hypothetical protein